MFLAMYLAISWQLYRAKGNLLLEISITACVIVSRLVTEVLVKHWTQIFSLRNNSLCFKERYTFGLRFSVLLTSYECTQRLDCRQMSRMRCMSPIHKVSCHDHTSPQRHLRRKMQEINFIVYLQYSTAHEQIQTIILIDTTKPKRALLHWACSWPL